MQCIYFDTAIYQEYWCDEFFIGLNAIVKNFQLENLMGKLKSCS